MSTTRHPEQTLPLAHRQRVDWHDHPDHQLAYPSHGVLEVSTNAGTWVVPPHRAVWLPAKVPHSHQAYGPTQLRTVNFAIGTSAAGFGRPTVLAVSALLREVIVCLTGDEDLTAGQRRNLRRVALDQLRQVAELPLHLPLPADDRLRASPRRWPTTPPTRAPSPSSDARSAPRNAPSAGSSANRP